MLLKIEHVFAYMIQIVCTASGRSHLHRSFATVARRYWYLEKIYEEADEASREPMRNNREKLLSFVEETKLGIGSLPSIVPEVPQHFKDNNSTANSS